MRASILSITVFFHLYIQNSAFYLVFIDCTNKFKLVINDIVL